MKDEQKQRDVWLISFDTRNVEYRELPNELLVTRAEAERIFADRIAAHEAKLAELGWTRKVRVEPQPEKVS